MLNTLLGTASQLTHETEPFITQQTTQTNKNTTSPTPHLLTNASKPLPWYPWFFHRKSTKQLHYFCSNTNDLSSDHSPVIFVLKIPCSSSSINAKTLGKIDWPIFQKLIETRTYLNLSLNQMKTLTVLSKSLLHIFRNAFTWQQHQAQFTPKTYFRII